MCADTVEPILRLYLGDMLSDPVGQMWLGGHFSEQAWGIKLAFDFWDQHSFWQDPFISTGGMKLL